MPARGGKGRLEKSLVARPASTVFLAVPDSALAGISRALAGAGLPATISFAHLSGALDLEVFGPLGDRHAVGSFHPLRAFPTPQRPDAFRGIVIAIDATGAALRRRLSSLARDLGARPRIVAGKDRVLYHVAAVLASNYAVALLGEAAGLLEEIGWSRRAAVAGLVPLMEGAISEVARRGPAAALTGPIRRGDAATVERHLEVLERFPQTAGGRPRTADLYRMLGSLTLEIASDAGLDLAAAARMRRALTRQVAATRRRRRR